MTSRQNCWSFCPVLGGGGRSRRHTSAVSHTRFSIGDFQSRRQTPCFQHRCSTNITNHQQVDSNIDLDNEWGEAFSTAVNEPTLVARAGIFTPGRTYTFSLTATDSGGAAGYAGKPISLCLGLARNLVLLLYDAKPGLPTPRR